MGACIVAQRAYPETGRSAGGNLSRRREGGTIYAGEAGPESGEVGAVNAVFYIAANQPYP